MNKTLDELRKEIDTVDEELIHILGKRMDIVREIGKLKKEKNIELLDQERWQDILKQINNIAAKHNLSEDLIKKIYEEIHQAALNIEKNL